MPRTSVFPSINPSGSRCVPASHPLLYGSLSEALEDFAWMLLFEYHCGFENNDGGYGLIVIDTRETAITIDHNDRVTDVVNTLTEV